MSNMRHTKTHLTAPYEGNWKTTLLYIYIKIALSNESDWVDESGLAPLDSLSRIDWLLLVCLFVLFFCKTFFWYKDIKICPFVLRFGLLRKKIIYMVLEDDIPLSPCLATGVWSLVHKSDHSAEILARHPGTACRGTVLLVFCLRSAQVV